MRERPGLDRSRPPADTQHMCSTWPPWRRGAAAVPVAIAAAFAACAPARVGTPVPRPFPSPAGAVTDRAGNPARPVSSSTARWSGPDFRRYLAQVEEVETGGDCLARPAGGSALGCYQMTRAALVDAGLNDAAGAWLDNPWGIDSDGAFQRDRGAQDAAMLRYTAKNWQVLEPCVRDLMGRTVGGVALDQAALVAGAHLLGATGLVRFVRCGLHERCVSPRMAALNGGARRLRADAMRRMRAAQGLRVLASTSTAGPGARCAVRG